MRKIQIQLFFAALMIALAGCYGTRKSKGGGQIGVRTERPVNAGDIALPPGYKIEMLTQGLTFPSAIAFDDQRNIYVIETGYSYGEVWRASKLLQIHEDGHTTLIAEGGKNGPWTSVVFHDQNFYVSEGGALEGGKILRINKNGQIKELVTGLPSIGDHHTDGLVIKDNYIYFGQGTATNSGVVGPDNKDFGWLERQPKFHDIPCRDITLVGNNYTSPNVLSADKNSVAVTGAFLPFGTPSVKGQVIKGKVPCTGSVMRIPINGGKPEMVAWGLRNPYGLALHPDGDIYITENAYDDRGSRPVWGAGDVLYKLEEGKWYGYPDYSAGQTMVYKDEFKVPGKNAVKPLMMTYPNVPPKPVAIFGVHSSANGFDFAPTSFGFAGEAFVAEFGDMSPGVGKVLQPVGFKIVRVNTNNGVIEDFAVNKGKKNAPASMLRKGGLERPLSLKFDDKGNMYLVDFGILRMDKNGPIPMTETGVVWKISKI